MAVLFFAVTLGPALGFVDFFPMRFSFVADHFQYHASVGLIVLAVAVEAHAVERARRRQAGLVAATVVLAALATLTWRQGHVYKDPETLYRDTLAKNPDSSMVHNSTSGWRWRAWGASRMRGGTIRPRSIWTRASSPRGARWRMLPAEAKPAHVSTVPDAAVHRRGRFRGRIGARYRMPCRVRTRSAA